MSMILQIIFLVLWLFELILLARVLMSWFPNVDRSNPIIQIIYDLTEPVLRPVRDLLPQTGMIDLSPLIVFLIIQVLLRLLQV
ncbi:MAG: YggT family protein [Chloroflexi bacterium]|jgi:YggT family protein|nr:YggT family protein [Chloroflexota bacterium]MDL1882112.1 YggT family protein [Anaerolineae bacterium CFX8]